MKSKDRKALKKFSRFKEITNQQGIFQGVNNIFKMFKKNPGDSNLKNRHLGGKFDQRYLHTSGGS